ncbi:MAG: EsaB/YukD family protein [Lachnospiraceae bacterium]|nr:EsaB/YukD family protein [Lachnospiraceae bacterium]
MILIEVCVPALDESYDFECDEKTAVETLVEEIISLIEEKEKIPCREREGRCLYVSGQGRFLKGEEGMEKQGINSGDKLILV